MSRRIDFFLLLIILSLLAIGTVTVYSSSAYLGEVRYRNPAVYFHRQVIWAGLALVTLWFFSRIDYHRWRPLAPWGLAGGILLLIAVLFFPAKNDAHRWIDFGPIQFQPSELFKLAVILYVAAALAKRGHKISDLRYLLLPYAPLLGVAFILLMLEPDLGTFLVIAGIVFSSLAIAGARWKHLLTGFLAAALVVSVLVVGLGYKQQRVKDYVKSWEDPLAGSYQVKQAMLGLSLGGLTGAGLGEGRQKMLYLPAPHTDFIFAAIGEEGGLLWLALILALFFVLIWRGWLVAQQAPDRFGFSLAFGITALLFTSITLNVGVVLGLLPTTGIPLPFLSYGGTALLAASAGCGVLLNIASQKEMQARYGYVR